MTADLVAFLRARLDEDEAAVLAIPADERDWEVPAPPFDDRIFASVGTRGCHSVATDAEWGPCADYDIAHIMRHRPERVLRDVAAKRRIVENYVKVCGYGHGGYTTRDEAYVLAEGALATTLAILAAVYEDHPDYQAAWKP